jgi:hypothetical protein
VLVDPAPHAALPLCELRRPRERWRRCHRRRAPTETRRRRWRRDEGEASEPASRPGEVSGVPLGLSVSAWSPRRF